MTCLVRQFAILLLTMPSACSREPAPSPVATPAAANTTPAAVNTTPAAANTTPADSLDHLDARSAVPLLPQMALHQKQNMRDHLVAVQEIIAGLAAADFESIEKAASRIGLSEQMGQMCTHMGAGAPGFTEQALAFHQTADRIAVAARERDSNRVLSEFNATLQSCTACHATWKQQIVDDATWQRLTALAH